MVVDSVDTTLNAVRITDSDDFIAQAAIEGVILLDHALQGRVTPFHLRNIHMLNGNQKELFDNRASGFGTVAGVTSGWLPRRQTLY